MPRGIRLISALVNPTLTQINSGVVIKSHFLEIERKSRKQNSTPLAQENAWKAMNYSWHSMEFSSRS
jgi:hypothetical protein